ncbi:DNA-binding CsgD family transcriptional regulator/PAS domain-containing protein [Rhodoblastus acidophilus]|uniref:LuxR C-terminal-related transcriptional regulator n=1 Tax=Rhodoblastus acidophilus TaxID=1074 RepID=UPI002224899B|nr:LuxR C-terminal-related transcriptional regulator [Rhodoblastus acidophilus]MCW2283489.1 DNA-binding CsgD family transcriptional regulator/PAS domain-containing protein [Rhodoblastus acidophilus]MCW2332187.1 DNA-binding CsgD family transcriptional regulator/PAS domain-containing protein [Rhodoblastus acidophilus]
MARRNAAMLNDRSLLDLVGAIYDCSMEPARWPETLERIATSVGGVSASLSIHDPLRREARFSAIAHETSEAEHADYNENYVPICPVLTSGWYCEIDEVVSAIAYVGAEEWVNSRYYQGFYKPRGWHDALGLHLAKSASRYSILSVVGPLAKGAFGAGEQQALSLLGPHLRRAASIADLLDARSLQHDMLSATLDLLTVGIVLTDAQGRIAYFNRSADSLLQDRSGLCRAGDFLSARDPAVGDALRAAIATASGGGVLAMPRSGIALPIPRAKGQDLAAWVLPLDAGLRSELAAPFAASVAVFVKELGDTSPFPGELFVKRYAITPAECRVLMLLAQGMSPAEIADVLGLSLPTVKTHLARLFDKTGAHGQAALMRLAVSALAPGRMEPHARPQIKSPGS